MKKMLLSIMLGCGFLGCGHKQIKPDCVLSANEDRTLNSGQPMGTVLYGQKSVPAPLYSAKIKPEFEYYYSAQEAAGDGNTEVKLACVIDTPTSLAKVVHYTHSCAIGKCPLPNQQFPDSQRLGEGIELHLDPTQNLMDCSGVPVQIPPHPGL